MSIKELIALAAIRSGKRQQQLAVEMGHTNTSRISHIATGRLEANASEIIYFASKAGLQPIKTLAEIEAQRHPELAFVWSAMGVAH
jgi:hypothetical protein